MLSLVSCEDFRASGLVLSNLVEVISFKRYRRKYFAGLCYVVGGQNQQMSRVCIESLLQYLEDESKLNLKLWIVEELVRVLKDSCECRSNFVTTMKVIIHFYEDAGFEEIFCDEPLLVHDLCTCVIERLRKPRRSMDLLYTSAKLYLFAPRNLTLISD